MKPTLPCVAFLSLATLGIAAHAIAPGDPRLREVTYDPNAVVTVPVQRGVVTLVALDPDESILEVGAGLGSDCNKSEMAWCVAAQAGGRTIFIKPKSTATAPNNLTVVTNRRAHTFRFVVLADGDPKPPVYRLTVKPPHRSTASSDLSVAPVPRHSTAMPPSSLPLAPVMPSMSQLLEERMTEKPRPVNTAYSLAEGHASQDIVPTLIFDDGRFTYLRFPGHRELPAVFQVMADDSESIVNVRMEEDLLVVDRVCRRLVLRAGASAVGIWNEAFDIEGMPARHGATVPGVQRLIKGSNDPHREQGITP